MRSDEALCIIGVAETIFYYYSIDGTSLWQKFGEELHMGVMAKCPHTFSHVMYFVLDITEVGMENSSLI